MKNAAARPLTVHGTVSGFQRAIDGIFEKLDREAHHPADEDDAGASPLTR